MNDKYIAIDRSRYDNSVLNVCQILSTYFVNVYYNEIYLRIKELKSVNKGDKLRDSYRQGVTMYFRSLKNKPVYYKKVIMGIHDLHNKFKSLSTLRLRDCIDSVCKEFVAKEAYDQMTDSQRQGIVRKVILDVNACFIDHIFNNRLDSIINEHKHKENAGVLREEFIDMLLLEREKLLNDYYGVVVGGNKRNLLSNEMGEKLKSMLTEAVKQKVIALKRLQQAERHNKELQGEVDNLKAQLAKQLTDQAGSGLPSSHDDGTLSDDDASSELSLPVQQKPVKQRSVQQKTVKQPKVKAKTVASVASFFSEEDGSAPPPKKGKGKKDDKKAIQIESDVESAGFFENASQSESEPQELEEENDGSQMDKDDLDRLLGSNASLESEVESDEPEDELEDEPEESEPEDEPEDEPEVKPKRRGRPPKNPPVEKPAPKTKKEKKSLLSSDSSEDVPQKKTPAKKKPGVVFHQRTLGKITPAPKKRGRPRKTQDLDDIEDQF